MVKKVTSKLNKLKNSGATMIVAIIVMTILIVFTFMLTLIAYTLYASQNKNLSSMRCAEATNTLSLAIDDELQDINAAQKSHIYQYARFNVGQSNWPYYDPKDVTGGNHDKAHAFRYYNLKYNPKKLKGESVSGAKDGDDRMEGFPGNIKLCLYWELPEGVTFDQLSAKGMKGTLLFVEITSEAANQSYTVTNVYELNESEYTSLIDDLNNKYYLEEVLTEDGGKGSINAAVNPLGNTIDQIDINKKWEWVRVYDEY